MSEPAELELFTTEELITEVLNRMDHGIFAGMIVTASNEDGTGDNYAQHLWKGCSLTCAGLASEIQHRILRSRVNPKGEDGG